MSESGADWHRTHPSERVRGPLSKMQGTDKDSELESAWVIIV
jgi:hypothetical protein